MTIGMSILLLGCSESPRNENGHHVAEKTSDGFSIRLAPGSGDWTFKYIEVDGHEFLVMMGTHRSGFTHSPKCKCQNNKLILDIALPETNFPPIHAIELVNTYTNNCATNQIWGN